MTPRTCTSTPAQAWQQRQLSVAPTELPLWAEALCGALDACMAALEVAGLVPLHGPRMATALAHAVAHAAAELEAAAGGGAAAEASAAMAVALCGSLQRLLRLEGTGPGCAAAAVPLLRLLPEAGCRAAHGLCLWGASSCKIL